MSEPRFFVGKDGSHVLIEFYRAVQLAGDLTQVRLTVEEAVELFARGDGAISAIRDEELTELGLQATGFDVYGEQVA